jgi:hypothetical protein
MPALSELTDRDAVLAAIREYDALGQAAFLNKYGYSPARQYQLVHDGKTYDSKAIVGVAFKYQFPDRGALKASDFSGGENTVASLLQRLNFEVRMEHHPTLSSNISGDEVARSLQTIQSRRTSRSFCRRIWRRAPLWPLVSTMDKKIC